MIDVGQSGSGLPLRYTVRTKRSYWAARGLGAAALALACAAFLRTGAGIGLVVGVAGFLMFGAFTAYALRQLLRTQPRLTLDHAGIDAGDLGVGAIPWAEIDCVQTFGSHEAPFIAFHVREPERYVARMSPWARAIQRLHRVSGLPAFSVNLIGVDRDLAEIAERAHALRDRVRET